MHSSFDERLTTLEKEVAGIKMSLGNGKRTKDWRRTIGMFAGDDLMKQIDAEALKYREADRRKARRQSPQRRKATK